VYGNPKILICLFPDFYRTFITKNYNFINFKDGVGPKDSFELGENEYYTHITKMHSEMDGDRKQIVKMPTDPMDIIQPDLSYYLSLSHISMLEQYCKSNNIVFLWSVWQESNHRTLQSIKSKHEGRLLGLLDIEMDKWESDFKACKDIFKSSKCHLDLENKNPNVFHFAEDRKLGIEKAHWGSHRNAHVSEIFIEKISSHG